MSTRAKWFAAAAVVLACTCGAVCGVEHSEESQGGGGEALPIDAAFDRLAGHMLGWSLVQRDTDASVDIAGVPGYRIVFKQRDLRRCAAADGTHVLLSSLASTEAANSYADFVLFPDEGPIFRNASAIPWPQRKDAHETKEFFLGRAMGFAWFAKADALVESGIARDIGLEEVDMTALYAGGLTSVDPYTAFRCAQLLAREKKEAALAYFEKALEERREAGLSDGPLIMALGNIRNERGDELLTEAYRGDCREFAVFVLSNGPYRRRLKELYLDMLENGHGVFASTQAAIEFTWVDFKPALEKIICDHLLTAYDCYPLVALRALDGAPIPESAIKARDVIVVKDESRALHFNEEAAEAITSLEDKEAAAALAVSLIFRLHRKGMSPRRDAYQIEAARTLVSRLPQEATLPLIEALARRQKTKEKRYKDPLMMGAIAQLRLAAMGVDGPSPAIRPMIPQELGNATEGAGEKTEGGLCRALGRAVGEESAGPLVTGIDAVGLFLSLAPDYREMGYPHHRKSVGDTGVRYNMMKRDSDQRKPEHCVTFIVGVFRNREEAVTALGREVGSMSVVRHGPVGLGDRAYCGTSPRNDYTNIRFRRKNVLVYLGLPLPEDEAIALAGRMDVMLEHDSILVSRGGEVAAPQAVLKGLPDRLKPGEAIEGVLEILEPNPEEIIVGPSIYGGSRIDVLSGDTPSRMRILVRLDKAASNDDGTPMPQIRKATLLVANGENVVTAIEHEISVEP